LGISKGYDFFLLFIGAFVLNLTESKQVAKNCKVFSVQGKRAYMTPYRLIMYGLYVLDVRLMYALCVDCTGRVPGSHMGCTGTNLWSRSGQGLVKVRATMSLFFEMGRRLLWLYFQNSHILIYENLKLIAKVRHEIFE
jgi:hypothetical protein